MADRQKVIKGLTVCSEHGLLNGEDCHGHYEYTDNLADIIKVNDYSKQCPYNGCKTGCVKTLAKDAFALLKEHESMKQKMWNALYAEEDELEKKFVGSEDHHAWFAIYRPWLQRGFEIAIKVISEQEGQ